MQEAEARLWEDVQDYIRVNTKRQQYETWFSNLRPVHMDTERIEIETPNRISKEWIEKNYLKLVRSAVDEVLGKTVQVELIVSEEPDLPVSARLDSFQRAGSMAGYEKVFPVEETKGYMSDEEFILIDSYIFGNFVVGPSNRLAHAAALAVSENPSKAYNPLFLHGSVGLGKTHLLQAICHNILKKRSDLSILFLSCETFINHFISAVEKGELDSFRYRYRHVDVLLIDDIHFLANKERTEEEFFHTFNTLYNSQKQIVLSSDRPPKEITDIKERLISRFKWGLVTKIESPTFEVRVAILQKKARLRGRDIPEDVAHYIATHIDSNIRELEGAIIKLTGYSTLYNKKIDLDLAKEALKDSIVPRTRDINITDIQNAVIRRFNLKLHDLQSKKRNKSVVFPRQIAMYLARNLTELSLEEIGGYFGGRDHTTVLYTIEKIKRESDQKPQVMRLLQDLTQSLSDR
jgi:chromosomal replication initiator protein